MTFALFGITIGARRGSMSGDAHLKPDGAAGASTTAASTPASSESRSPSSPAMMAAKAAKTTQSRSKKGGKGDHNSDGAAKEAAKKALLVTDLEQLMHSDSNYSAKDIADFLHQLPHLDPVMVGRVLGEVNAFELKVLEEYANGFLFAGVPIELALRVYLGRFVIPGEAQKIDRILQAFAKAYYIANPTDPICTSEDAVHVLAFSLVLLNTDAHNPSLAKRFRMTKPDFIRNLQQVDGMATSVPRRVLSDWFDSITSHAIQLIPRKPPHLLPHEVELTFGDGPLGLDIETAIDTRTCLVKRYASPPRHLYCSTESSPESIAIDGFVIVAVADDCTQDIGYTMTRYLLKTATRPVTIRFAEPSIYFASRALNE